jgi:hypothetical protein
LFPERDEADVVCGQSLLPVRWEKVFWDVAEVGLLTSSSQFTIVANVTEFCGVFLEVSAIC